MPQTDPDSTQTRTTAIWGRKRSEPHANFVGLSGTPNRDGRQRCFPKHEQAVSVCLRLCYPQGMDAPESLQVDLANPSDIKEKLPHAESILSKMEDELRRQQREIQRWRNLVEVLRSVAGAVADHSPQPATEAPAPATEQPSSVESQSPVQDLVVDVVNREIREIRSKEVRATLADEGHELSADSVSNSLWNAAEKARIIQRIRRGWYAPLDYVNPVEDALDVPAHGASNSLTAPPGIVVRASEAQQLEPEGRTAPDGERTGDTPGDPT